MFRIMDCENPTETRSSKVLHSFKRVHKGMMRFVHKTALENDLSLPQYSVLITIAPYRQLTQKQLGEIIQIPKSTLSQAVDGLVQAGWIEREPVQDNRREMQLTISEKGKILCETMRVQKGSIHQTLDKAINTLSEKQYNELLATHLQIAEFLEKEALEQGEMT